jgi:tRNA1Val (adenine37-N6)-methyltransferase
MIAQKSTGSVEAIDIDEGAYEQARENILISPWFNRIRVLQESFQHFADNTEDKYDLIVTTPPYFHEAFKPLDESRFQARHTDLAFHLTILSMA